MRAFIIIATKGRAKEARVLLDYFERQTVQPEYTVFIGASPQDIEGLSSHAWMTPDRGEACVSPKIGSTAQRNHGLEILARKGFFDPRKGRFFCAYFDDDYRPADDWLERAGERFNKGDIVGLTGCVLADGVKTGGLSEQKAQAYLKGEESPQQHWASGAQERHTDSVYGCNMAFIDTASRTIRFDEALPLYAWQEDRDYTGMANKIGNVIYFPACKGVHLGARSGRISGIKFGYSQIANPLYLMKKGTMGYGSGLKHVGKALLGNGARSFTEHPLVDYRGRFRGNMRALADLLRGKLHPGNLPQ